jgi:hypothetical protein
MIKKLEKNKQELNKKDESQKKRNLQNNKISIESIPIDKIIIPEILNITYNKEDINNIAEAIESTDKIVYPIVIKDGEKYRIYTELHTYHALKQKNEKFISVIKEDISEEDGYLLGIKDLLCRPDISSIEKEILITTLYEKGTDKGPYKDSTEYAKKIGLSPHHVADNIQGYKERIEIFDTEVTTSTHISTETLKNIRPLELEDKKNFCKRIKDGKIQASHARDVIRLFEDISEEQKKAILNGDLDWRDMKRIVDTRFPAIKEINNILKKYYTIEQVNKINESDKIVYNSESFRQLVKVIYELNPIIYLDNILDENQKKDALSYFILTGLKIFRDLTKYAKLSNENYENICKTFDIEPEIIENLIDDGYCYFLPDIQLTDVEKKIKQKLNKILRGKAEPLLRL